MDNDKTDCNDMPERIWLIPNAGNDGETVWCDDPAPGADMDPDDAVEYRRADLCDSRQVRALEIEDLIEELLDAQQDINLAANERMDQSLCDASALIDRTESILRRILAALTASPGWQPIETISRAAQDVLAERQRQISVEGWDDTNDDCNDKSELAQAAACYALSGTPADEAVFIHGRWKDPRDLFWPWTWDRSWWKPTNRRRDLVKAGALILAEIERLDRAAPEAEGGIDA